MFGCIELFFLVFGGIIRGGVEFLVEFGCVELLLAVLGGIVCCGVGVSIIGGLRVTTFGEVSLSGSYIKEFVHGLL